MFGFGSGSFEVAHDRQCCYRKTPKFKFLLSSMIILCKITQVFMISKRPAISLRWSCVFWFTCRDPIIHHSLEMILYFEIEGKQTAKEVGLGIHSASHRSVQTEVPIRRSFHHSFSSFKTCICIYFLLFCRSRHI